MGSLLQRENQAKHLESELTWKRYRFKEKEKEKDLKEEHDEYLRLEEKLHDKEFLKQQLKEIEHMHDLNRFHNHDREMIINGR